MFYNRCSCISGSPNPGEPHNPPPAPCPPECLVVTDAYIPCAEGMNPDSANLVLDIGAETDNSVSCPDCLTYEVIDFDSNQFSTVVVDAAGVFTIAFNPAFMPEPNGIYEIRYRINCSCLGTRIEGKISICINPAE